MLTVVLAWAIVGYALYLIGVLWDLPSISILAFIFILLSVFSVTLILRAKLIVALIDEVKRLWNDGILERLLITVAIFQLVLNLIGAASPELSFDALWYHLPLPQLYLERGEIWFPRGNLLPSGLPRLAEMWYTLLLSIDRTATMAKFMHLIFGLLSFALIYSLSRKHITRQIALLVAVDWYTMLSVGWLSTTAYTDLYVVVFLLLAVRGLVEKEDYRLGGLLFGLASSVKMIFIVPSVLIAFWIFIQKKPLQTGVKNTLNYTAAVIMVIIPWLSISWIKTGDPIYPLLTYQPESVISAPLSSFLGRLGSFVFAPWQWTFKPDTPISPVYVALIPVFLICWSRWNKTIKAYFILAMILLSGVWFFPQFSNRYLLPGLAVLSVPVAVSIYQLQNRFRKITICFLVISIGINVFARTLASQKFIPFISGEQSKEEFLASNLDLDFGNYIDRGGKIAKLVGSNKVLITDIHNLFYVDFPFDHISWADNPENYRYLLVRKGAKLPSGYEQTKLVYTDVQSEMELYLNE